MLRILERLLPAQQPIQEGDATNSQTSRYGKLVAISASIVRVLSITIFAVLVALYVYHHLSGDYDSADRIKGLASSLVLALNEQAEHPVVNSVINATAPE